jgi:LCP family protein required for cell wall assembly
MTNSDGSDPRRRARRYGPTSGSPATPRSYPAGRAGGNPARDNPPTAQLPAWNPEDPPYGARAPYPPRANGASPSNQSPYNPPPNNRSPYNPPNEPPPYQPRPYNPPPYNPPAYGTPAGHGPVRPSYGGPAAVPPAFGGGTPPSGGPPTGGPPGGPRSGGPSDPDPRRRRGSGAVLTARITALVLAGIVLLGAGVAWAFTGTLQGNSGTSDAAGNAGDGGVTFEGGMTILLVGSDARTDADGNPLSAEELQQVGTEDDGGGVNTDTIMLVHIPEGGGKATAVSLPRDTWIPQRVMDQVVGPYANGTEGAYAPNKINSYYATAKAYTAERLVGEGVTDKAQIERESNEAGRTMLIRVVQAFTGMKVDHYAEVNLLGFYLLSNAIGGVPVCLNAAVNDPWSGADFAAGPQEVQGTAALAFVRQRHGLPEGDLDRVRRQQAFLAGAADKILSVGTLTNPSKLSDLVGAVDRSVVFDKNFSVLTFAEQITNLSSGNINFATLPTTGSEPSTDKDALATNPAEISAFFAAISGGTAAGQETPQTAESVDPSSITVDVQDGTIADGVTAYAADTINNGGFTLGSLGVVAGTSSGNEQSTTEIRYPAGGQGQAQQVADAFGLGELIEDDAIDTGHVLVVVGTDLDVPSGLRAPGAAFSAPTVAAPAAVPPAAAPAAAQFAAAVPCVN